MKDITSTSFGLVIAYLLPGLAGLYGLTFWSGNLRVIRDSLLQSGTDLGLVLTIVAVALIIGLTANSIRWLVFERLLCSSVRLNAAAFANLLSEHKLAAFLAIIEETFRYHQFMGNTAVLIPFLFLSWMRWYDLSLFASSLKHYAVGFFLLEVVLAMLHHELSTGQAGLKTRMAGHWLKRLLDAGGITSRARPIIRFVMIAVLPLAWLATAQIYTRDQIQFVTVFVCVVGFVFLELLLAANAIFSLSRYIERIQSMKGDTQ